MLQVSMRPAWVVAAFVLSAGFFLLTPSPLRWIMGTGWLMIGVLWWYVIGFQRLFRREHSQRRVEESPPA